VKPTNSRSHSQRHFQVTVDGEGIANHVGSAALRELTDALGFTRALSRGMARSRQRRSAHDPGRVLRDLVVMLSAGGDCVSDLANLRHQPDLFGTVASTPTAWPVIDAMTEADLGVLSEARRQMREQAWRRGAAPLEIVLDFDATLVSSHSEKEGAAPTFKHGFGFHPLACYLDESGDALAAKLRPGNAGSNTVVDHEDVLVAAVLQLPAGAQGSEILARADSSGASHGFIDRLREFDIRFSVGFDLTEPVRAEVLAIPENAWRPAITQAGEHREGPTSANSTTSTSAPGRPGPAPSAAGNGPIPGLSSPSPTSRAIASKSSSPTRATPTSRSWKPATAPTPGSKTASAAPRTPGCATCRSTTSWPTRSGSSSCSPPRT
jgi:hypothetical protein